MFKRILPFAVIVFFLVSNPIIAIAESFTESVPDSSTAVLTESETGIVISIENYFSGDSSGDPSLPVKDIKLLIAPDTILGSVQVELTGDVKETSILETDIAPVPPIIMAADGDSFKDWGEGKEIENGRNILIYNQNKFYPESHVEFAEMGNMRKWKIITLRYYPYRYNPVTKELVHSSGGNISVSFSRESTQEKTITNFNSRSSNRVDVPKAISSTKQYNMQDKLLDSAAKRITSNFSNAHQWYDIEETKVDVPLSQRNSRSSIGINISGEETVSADSPGYIIVTTDAIVNSSVKLQEFIVHKESMGFNVEVVTKSDWENINSFTFDMNKTPTADLIQKIIYYYNSSETRYNFTEGRNYVSSHWENGLDFINNHSQFDEIEDYLNNTGLGAYIPDDADKIRQYLINNWESKQIQYVLLMGDPTPPSSSYYRSSTTGPRSIPMKMMWPRSYDTSSNSKYKNTPSDYYFADLTGSWDSNDNGLVGESYDFGVGGVDRLQEVFVGRVPYYGNITELDSILNKFIRYENGDFGDGQWSKKVLLSMKPSDSSTPGYHLGERIKEDFIDGSDSLYAVRIYDEDYGLASPAEYIPCDYANVLDAWTDNSQGAGLHVWWTHGASTYAASVFRNSSCQYLNDETPAFVFSVSCNNGYPGVTSNLGYSMLKHGAIGTITAARVSWYYRGSTTFNNGSNAGMSYRFTPKLINDGLSVGESLFEMKTELSYTSVWMNHLVFNLYGDPSITYYSQSTIVDAEILSPETGTIGDASVEVEYRITQDGEVTLYDNDNIVLQENQIRGNHVYTFENLSLGLHNLKMVIVNQNGESEDSIVYTAGQKIKGLLA